MLIKIYDEIPEQARMIREAVFTKEQGFKDEFDETDHLAKHVLLFEEDISEVTCRFFFFEGRDCYVIGKIAVRKKIEENDRVKKTANCDLHCSETCVNIIIGRREAWVMP